MFYFNKRRKLNRIIKRSFLALSLFLIVIQLFGAPKARDGILDLRNWDGKGIITLDGEWKFYWQVFISDTILTNGNEIKSPLIVDVPSYWSEYFIDTEALPGKGYGSYSLSILLPATILEDDLALDIPIFDDSYVLFLNDERVARNGKVGINSDQAEPGYKPKIYIFHPDSEKIELIIHVSNYKHRRGGFWKSIRMGGSERLIHQKKIYDIIVHITIGFILSFFLFFLAFFIFYPKNKSALYFSLFSFGLLLRILSTDTFAIQIFSNPPWEWIIRLEYLGTYIAFVFGSWYFLNIYPGKNIKIIVKLNTVVIGLICLFVIVLEPAYFAFTMFYFQPVILLFFTYYLIISFVHIFKRNEADEFYFAALLIFLIALVNDIRVSASAPGIFNDYTIHFALQVFIFTHVLLMIRSWVKAYKELGKLNFEIEYLNLNLEERIKKRTEESNADKKEIQKQHEEISLKNEELRSRIEFSSKIQSIMAHDLRSPITSLYQVSSYLSTTYGDGELKETLDSIRDLSGSASALLDNLLFWARSQQGEIHYSPQSIKIQDLINEILSMYRVSLKQKFVVTDTLITENLETFCDPLLLKIVLRNLFSNALKFSKKKGKITITASLKKDSEDIVLIIEDKGVGIHSEVLKVLNNSSNKDEIEISTGTSNEKGSGLGIRLSQELIQINKGTMRIESSLKKGTRVIIYLPGV